MTVEADKFPQRKPVERMSDEEVRERLGRLADRINEGVATSLKNTIATSCPAGKPSNPRS